MNRSQQYAIINHIMKPLSTMENSRYVGLSTVEAFAFAEINYTLAEACNFDAPGLFVPDDLIKNCFKPVLKFFYYFSCGTLVYLDIPKEFKVKVGCKPSVVNDQGCFKGRQFGYKFYISGWKVIDFKLSDFVYKEGEHKIPHLAHRAGGYDGPGPVVYSEDLK